MESMFIPFLLIIFASFFQGTFGVGMKYIAPLKWESWWMVYATIAMLIFPIVWALIAVPGLFRIIAISPIDVVLLAMLLGFLWGIGGILFGVSIPYIGISLTYGIVMGLASSVGSLIPFFQIKNATHSLAFPFIMSGIFVMLIGVAITAMAGIKGTKYSTGEIMASPVILSKG